MTQANRSLVLLLILACSIVTGAAAATAAPDPVEWVKSHWVEIVTSVAAFFIVYHIRRIDRKFEVIFRWKDKVDERMGVHDQVWNHGDGCGPLWVHHREDGGSAVHFRAADHPGLCEHCKTLQGKIITLVGPDA